MSSRPAEPPLQVVISGGEGDLARPLTAEFEGGGMQVYAPGRREMDVRDETRVDAYFQRLQRIDILIVNAGIVRDGLAVSMDDADSTEVLATNLRGAFLCVRAALKLMLAQRSGHILLIGSRAGRNGTRGQSLYAAAKAGLIGLGQSVAREYGSRNIRCNIVLPGFLETKMTAKLSTTRREEVRQEHVLGRFNTVGNAARFIAFLATLDHVSGQVFTLDSRMDRWT